MLNKWILLFHTKEKGASVYVNKQYESKGQAWFFKLRSITEHWKGFLGHPEQTISCPPRWLPAEVNHRCGLAEGRAQTESLAPGKPHREVAQQKSATHPQSSGPSALLPTSERGNDALPYFCTFQLLKESGIILSWNSSLECGFFFFLVFILPFLELIPRDREAKFACPQTWHCSAQKVGTDILALHSWGSAGATPVGSAQFRLCMPLTCLLCKSGSESR